MLVALFALVPSMQASTARDAFLARCSDSTTAIRLRDPAQRLVLLDIGANDGTTSIRVARECSRRLIERDASLRPNLQLVLMEADPPPALQRVAAMYATIVRAGGLC